MLRQTHCHVSFTRLGISSSNNKLYRLLYIRERERMSGLVIWYEHECPGWSFDVSTNVRGGHSMWARMSGVVIWCEHECPALSKIAWERMSVGTNVRTPRSSYNLCDTSIYFSLSFFLFGEIKIQTCYIKQVFLFCNKSFTRPLVCWASIGSISQNVSNRFTV